jgi:hypothetical protein
LEAFHLGYLATIGNVTRKRILQSLQISIMHRTVCRLEYQTWVTRMFCKLMAYSAHPSYERAKYSKPEEDGQMQTELHAQVKSMTSCPSNNASYNAYCDTIAATLIAACNMQLKSVDERDVAAFKYFCQYLTQHTSVPFEPHEIDKTLDNITRAATLYWHNLRQACLDRRLFTTSDGRLGIGPKSMRQGDIVDVIYGGITPYVLRPFKDYY